MSNYGLKGEIKMLKRYDELTKLIKNEKSKEYFRKILEKFESEIYGIDNIKITCNNDGLYTFMIERFFKCKNMATCEERIAKEYVEWTEQHGVLSWETGFLSSDEFEIY